MLDTLLEHCLAELRVIRETPIAFAVSVLFVGALLFVGLRWIESEQVETMNATIKYQDEQLSAYRSGTGSNSPSEAAAKTVELQSQVRDLQRYKREHEAQEWPALTPTQQQEWVRAFSKYSGHLQMIEITDQDSRGELFVDSLVKAFEAAHLPKPHVVVGGFLDGLNIYARPIELGETAKRLLEQFGYPPMPPVSDQIAAQSILSIRIGRRPAQNTNEH